MEELAASHHLPAQEGDQLAGEQSGPQPGGAGVGDQGRPLGCMSPAGVSNIALVTSGQLRSSPSRALISAARRSK